MRTDDILALSNCPDAKHRLGVPRRRSVLGMIVAAGLMVLALAATYATQPADAVVPHESVSDFSALPNTERSGTLSGLQILF